MDNVAADFTINENEPIQAEYSLGEPEHFDCSFELFAAGTAWGLITGNIEEQTDLLAALNTKANADSVNHDLNALEGEISDLSYTVNNNYSTITNRLENDELTISNNYTELSGYITSISNTIQSYGDIVTYNASSFATSAQGALANTALQPNDNISRLTNNVGYITSTALPTKVSDLTNDIGYITGVSWNEVTNKPSTFTPSYHEHVSSEITDLSTTIASAITNKADRATSLSGYGITDAYTKTEIDGMVSAGMHYKGTKSSVSQLPSSGNQVGDLWNVDDTGANYAWNGSSWDKLSENIDLSGYVPTSRTINGKSLSGDISLTASDVNALPSNTSIPSKTSDLTNDSGFITNTALNGYATQTWVGQQGYITGIDSTDVTTALGYTPYNATNPNNYITSSALTGYATESWVGQQGYITGITSNDVTTALGYTPYNSTNPNGYITGVTSSDITTALGYTPANDTLSNLGATSSKNFDGEWVIKNITIAASVTWDGSTTDATYSIANQLPNDNYTYEVLITGIATATGTAGRFMTIQLTTDVQTSSVYLCSARSSSSIQNQTVGSVLIRVGSARTITQYSTTAAAANGTYSLYLKGYRRIGTNT